MPVRCPIHPDELFEAEGTKAEHRLHPEKGCTKCLADQAVARATDPATVLASARERQVAAKAAAALAARRAAEAKAEADKQLAAAKAAEDEAAAILAEAGGEHSAT